jgi:hypothetical protein
MRRPGLPLWDGSAAVERAQRGRWRDPVVGASSRLRAVVAERDEWAGDTMPWWRCRVRGRWRKGWGDAPPQPRVGPEEKEVEQRPAADP